MFNSKLRVIAVAVAFVGALSVAAAPAYARSAKCTAVPVPGQPGHFIVHCSTARP
jgi:hypothetical protein